MQLDRAQALIDNQMAQQMQYQADATSAFTGAASSAFDATTQMYLAGLGTGGDVIDTPAAGRQNINRNNTNTIGDDYSDLGLGSFDSSNPSYGVGKTD